MRRIDCTALPARRPASAVTASALLILLHLLVARAAFAEERAPLPERSAEWGVALRLDAEAFADIVRRNHPGPVDPANPHFSYVLEASLQKALERANRADERVDYIYALRELSASFDDGHLQILLPPHPPGFVRMWPGFLTTEKAGQHSVVVSRSDDAPPAGAALVSCDGLDAAALSYERLGRFSGTWMLRGKREFGSAGLFVDIRNPYAPRPTTCVFEHGGKAASYTLRWREYPSAEFESNLAALTKRMNAGIGLTSLPNGGFWISAGSFSNDPATEDAQKLTALVKEIEARSSELRAAKWVVLDLRGNNGGSSHWSSAMARAMWGEQRVSTKMPRSKGVDYRVSPDNIAHVENIVRRFSELPSGAGTVRQFSAVLAGMKAAHEQGQPLWRQQPGAAPADAEAAPSLMKGRVFVVTDSWCGSACLDAVDLWKALGATQAGRETYADSLYMEQRTTALPSGMATVALPIKVYRGRVRGSNVPQKPELPYEGDLNDTAALQQWLLAQVTANAAPPPPNVR